MVRKIAGIICYCIGGFFLSSVNVISFFTDQSRPVPISMKLLIMGIFLVPALIFIGAGIILRRLEKWKRDAAVVLLSTSAYQIFLILTMVCIFSSQEITKFFPDKKVFGLFNDYFMGAVCLLIFICLGFLCLKTSKSRDSDKNKGSIS
ncbi:MAG: hypothetical protein ABIH18_02635 [Candidatus Omnitrophota bacterium]